MVRVSIVVNDSYLYNNIEELADRCRDAGATVIGTAPRLGVIVADVDEGCLEAIRGLDGVYEVMGWDDASDPRPWDMGEWRMGDTMDNLTPSHIEEMVTCTIKPEHLMQLLAEDGEARRQVVDAFFVRMECPPSPASVLERWIRMMLGLEKHVKIKMTANTGGNRNESWTVEVTTKDEYPLRDPEETR